MGSCGDLPHKTIGGVVTQRSQMILYVTHVQLGIQTNTDCHLFLEMTNFNFDAVG